MTSSILVNAGVAGKLAPKTTLVTNGRATESVVTALQLVPQGATSSLGLSTGMIQDVSAPPESGLTSAITSLL